VTVPADPSRLFRLDDRVVVVTGASSGLGDRAARVFAAAGAQVVVAARRGPRVEALARQLGADAVGLACDVTRGADLDALVARTIEAFGRIDVLVNNAGISDDVPAFDEEDDAFRQVMDVNLQAAFNLTTRVGRVMRASGGGVVLNIASILGIVGLGRPPAAAYAASKAGLIGLTRELAAQWGNDGIRVNALAPGFFPSEMTTGLFADDAGRRFVRRRTLLDREPTAADLDGALLFLASDASAYVTGQVLVVDGGWTAL
jgi:NAD(P)-dependent dehydrogenase (short-subunit alcohol dehydrogenase family)